MPIPTHCDECGDDGSMYMHSRCHITSPTWAVLSGDILTIECAACREVVTRFRVVPEPAVDTEGLNPRGPGGCF